MSDPHPAGDTLGPMLDALGTLYGPETMLRRCHEKFADDPTVIAELRYELEAQNELLEAARDRARQLEDRSDQLARDMNAARRLVETLAAERDHATNGADILRERLSAALEQVRVQNLELWDLNRNPCGKHTTLTGDLTCSRTAGHDGAHLGGNPSVSWSVAREDDDQPMVEAHIACGAEAHIVRATLDCALADGHDGDHQGTLSW